MSSKIENERSTSLNDPINVGELKVSGISAIGYEGGQVESVSPSPGLPRNVVINVALADRYHVIGALINAELHGIHGEVHRGCAREGYLVVHPALHRVAGYCRRVHCYSTGGGHAGATAIRKCIWHVLQ